MATKKARKGKREDEAQAAVRVMQTIAERSERNTPKAVKKK